MGAKIAIEPDPVEQGNTIMVTVGIPGGGDLSSWHMRIVSAQDPAAIKLAPRGLDAYGAPRDGAADAYDCKIAIIEFKPGEYIVDLAPGGRFDTPDMVSKKFTVRPARVIVASAGRTDPDEEFMRMARQHGLY